MARDVYFREDILNVLRSAESAGYLPPELEKAVDYPEIQSYAVGYKDGFRRALLAVGLAFGFEWRVKDEADSLCTGTQRGFVQMRS